MEEEFRQADYQSRRFQEQRTVLAGIWRDAAAKDVTDRFLDPHQGHDEALVSGLRSQNGLLADAVTRSEEAAAQAQRAQERNGACRAFLGEVTQALDRAAGETGACRNALDDADDRLEECHQAVVESDRLAASAP